MFSCKFGQSLAGLMFVCALSGSCLADDTPNVMGVTIASGLQKPVFATHAPGDYRRLFIVEQGGKIKVMRDGVMLTTPFLDITGLVSSGALEPGLLGLAFHPN